MLYKNQTTETIKIDALQGCLWGMYSADGVQPGAIIDIPADKLLDHDVKIAIKLGRLIPVPDKPRTRVPWCPFNGAHENVRRSARLPACPNCKHSILTASDLYCPMCYACLYCERVIKRKFSV
jgi:hypothetical protein